MREVSEDQTHSSEKVSATCIGSLTPELSITRYSTSPASARRATSSSKSPRSVLQEFDQVSNMVLYENLSKQASKEPQELFGSGAEHA